MPTDYFRGTRAIGVFLVSVLLSGCQADDRNAKSRNRDSTTMGVNKTDGGAGTVIVLHMTGLLLVIPQNGGETQILFPKSEELHYARLGVGLDPAVTDTTGGLCVNDSVYENHPLEDGICYVDLKLWKLDAIGAGGQQPSSSHRMPSGLLNVTTLSGGRYRIHKPAELGLIDAEVRLLSGWPRPEPCRLADWQYSIMSHADEHQFTGRMALINVLDWQIQNPNSSHLRFKKDTIIRTVPLTMPETGPIRLILAHVPADDLRDLPPNQADTPNDPPDSIAHFDAYYDVLRRPTIDVQGLPKPSPRRQLPREPTILKDSCDVGITTPINRLFEPGAVGTYACVMATASRS
jgi:hypothetical protein